MADKSVPHPDTVHKFTLVRPVAKYREESLEKRFVILERSLSSAQGKTLEKADGSIVGYFKRGQLEKVKGGMSGLEASGDWIPSLAELSARYPDAGSVYAAFSRTRGDATASDLREAIEAALAKFDAQYTSLKKYVNEPQDAFFERKIALWDNMLVRYVNPSETPEVREECLRLIRLYWIMERLVASELEDGDVFDALAATVVLPSPLRAPAAPPPAPPSPPATPSQDSDRQAREDAKRVDALRSAERDILQQHAIQTKQVIPRKTARVKDLPPAGMLQTQHVRKLGDSTRRLLTNLKIQRVSGLHVPTALARIQTEIKSIQSPPRPPAVPQLLRIGTEYLPVSGFANWMDQATTYHPGGSAAAGNPFGPGVSTGAQLGQGFKVGMAPLYVVQTKLLKYETGEVAHVENVLAGESKKRNLRVLNRVETTVATDEETTILTEKDSQTTDKFELSHEVSENQKEDLKFDTGLKVTADLGTVNIAASADFSYANAKESTDKTASTQAREIVNKAVNSLSTRTRTQRSVTTVNESEDINEHVLANANPKTNISGIYRWLDKYYLAELKSYGSRKMLEFSVPEPAAFYLFAMAHRKSADPIVEKPVFPTVWAPSDPPETTDDNGYRPIQTYKDMLLPDEDLGNNYMDRIKQSYGYILPTAPKESLIYTHTIKSAPPAGGGSAQSYSGSDDITIPGDYSCGVLHLNGSYDPSSANPFGMLYVSVGNIVESLATIASGGVAYNTSTAEELWVGTLSVSYHLHVTEFVLDVVCECKLTEEAKDKWRKAAFDAILLEYNAKLKAYNQWLKELADAASMSVTITGNNPDRNREIEKEELKKNCVQILTGQRFESFDAMRYSPQVPPDAPYYGYPDFSFSDASEEGRVIQFFEEVFDWHLMTYEFFPYFWANKSRWTLLKSIGDTDPIFRSFLQAGSARVQVPVRKNYEAMVDYFLQTGGQIWNGGEAPSPGDALWLSVADDQKNNTDDSGGEVIDQWIVKLPTDLVFLDDFGSGPPDNTKALKGEMLPKIKDELGIQ